MTPKRRAHPGDLLTLFLTGEGIVVMLLHHDIRGARQGGLSRDHRRDQSSAWFSCIMVDASLHRDRNVAAYIGSVLT